MEEKNVAYFYDKKTKMVTHVWRHFQRVGKTNEIVEEDCTPEMVESHKGRMKEGEPWSYMLDRLTDRDVNNLGCVHAPFHDTPMSYLCVDESGPQPKLVPKPYLKLSVISADAEFLNSKSWGPSSRKDHYTFQSDGVKHLELKLEMLRSGDEKCKRKDTDKKDKSANRKVRVYVTRGRLDKKDGIYELENGECQIKWLLPDESICDAQIFAGDTHRDYVNSPFLCSNTIDIDCI